MNSRRAMLKILGVAPAAGASALAELGPLLTSPAALAASALAGTAGQMAPGGVGNMLGEVLGKQADRLLRAAEEEIFASRAVRGQGGLAADIASFRSVSRVNKERAQLERDIAELATMRMARQMMWGH